ncbi:MAG: FliH/SctL family protein [Acidimicrobiales bacterium]
MSSKKLIGAEHQSSSSGRVSRTGGSLSVKSNGTFPQDGSAWAPGRHGARQAMKVLKGAEAERATRAFLGEVRVAQRNPKTLLPEDVRRPVTSTLADRLEDARSTGYEEGYRKGREDAMSSMEAERVELTVKLVSSVEEAAMRLAEGRYEILKASSREIVDLAIRISEAILLRELVVSHDPGREALERAVGLAPQGSDLVVRMHPDDVVGPDYLASMFNGESIRIVEDGSVEKGGCVVQAGSCTIDGQVSTALKRVADLLGTSVQDGTLSVQQMSGRGRQ